MGGAIFQFLESEHSMNSYHLFEEAREDFKQSIVNLSVCDPELEGIDVKNLNLAITHFETKMNEIVCDEKVNIKGESTWSFWSSVFFSATVISTIGKQPY